MSLLKITTTPIEYEIKIERAKLQAKENNPQDLQDYQDAVRSQARNRARVSRPVAAQNTQKINEGAKSTTDFQNAARMRTAGKAVATTAANLVSNNISTAAENAKQTAGIETTEQKQMDFSSGLTNNVDFVLDDDMFVESFDTSNLTANSTQEWTVAKNDMEFVPGRFQMDIVQLPKVSIEYMGDFQYFPASANPDYEAPKA